MICVQSQQSDSITVINFPDYGVQLWCIDSCNVSSAPTTTQYIIAKLQAVIYIRPIHIIRSISIYLPQCVCFGRKLDIFLKTLQIG